MTQEQDPTLQDGPRGQDWPLEISCQLMEALNFDLCDLEN
jgi:hypothetical protein